MDYCSDPFVWDSVCGLRVAQNIHPLICFFLESFWCYQIFAAKSLSEESKKCITV